MSSVGAQPSTAVEPLRRRNQPDRLWLAFPVPTNMCRDIRCWRTARKPHAAKLRDALLAWGTPGTWGRQGSALLPRPGRQRESAPQRRPDRTETAALFTNQGENVFGIPSVRDALSVQVQGRGAIDAVLAAELDIAVNQRINLSVTEARPEFDLIEVLQAFRIVRELLFNVLRSQFLLMLKQEIMQAPEGLVALMLPTRRKSRRRASPSMTLKWKMPEHQPDALALHWQNVVLEHGRHVRAIRTLEI